VHITTCKHVITFYQLDYVLVNYDMRVSENDRSRAATCVWEEPVHMTAWFIQTLFSLFFSAFTGGAVTVVSGKCQTSTSSMVHFFAHPP